MSIPEELARARRLAFADDEAAARDLLLGLVPEIEQAVRDDLLLEVFAQLGELYLTRGALDGAAECRRRISDCLAVYVAIRAGTRPDLAAQVTLTDHQIDLMLIRYPMVVVSLDIGVAAARGDHDGAAALLGQLRDDELSARAHIRCAVALTDDDLYSRAEPLWRKVIELVEPHPKEHLFVVAALEYGRFCVETGRLSEAAPWLSRAEARAVAGEWPLSAARAQLERAAAAWAVGDHDSTERLINQAYPVIARHARSYDVSRCWLYLGLTRLAVGLLDEADDCWRQAEQSARDGGKSLHLYRILLQRSWFGIFTGDYPAATQLIEAARQALLSAPRHTWLQLALLDSQLGTVWRAAALADLGFDAADPDDLGVIDEPRGTARHAAAMEKLERAADLKIPAALAVDSVRFTIADPARRSQWAARVSAPQLAGAFAVAWEWENTELVSQLIEYHSARGMLATRDVHTAGGDWAATATETASVDGPLELAALPTLQMDPGAPAILGRYRILAQQRYGTAVTVEGPGWTTWP
ncbi:hypothetical protein BVC93_26835 [Mycobacterium sp. MS1601]|uniref:tetratricopeptide repeat protein n=1 Tax=Mycobacterium sp. MS1601 TaxID=1936029 RepID=UPI0009791D97|nr:hypothetical protein [Mycobacterium sp. MS1601]AQA05403.1 hypothetical protein BVC93_26835 [Mycobacterium sp. MS1601]